MADWVTISSMATAGGTLVLALATFSSVKSANRSARVAERSLMAGLRPVLIPSRDDDPAQRIGFGDGAILTVPGHGGALSEQDGRVYMAIALRNGGAGLAVLHGWRVQPVSSDAGRDPAGGARMQAPDVDDFRRQQRDLYIPAGEVGFWQGAVRDRDDPLRQGLHSAIESRTRVLVDLLYGDHEGGQRTIARFGLGPWEDVEGERAEVIRYWNVDGEDPR